MYRAVWRWHFYAGLFTIPIIVMLCLSGIVWLFRPQINRALYGNLITVAVAADQVATASYADQLKAVQAAYPDASISAVEPPAKANRSTKFDLTTTDGKTLSVFVNPYTGSVIGQRDNGKDPTNIALKLHGSLMTASWLGSEKWGDRLIEIVASWSILLVATGVYLWWPRGKRLTLKGVLKPRFDEVGRRTFWRDVHAITGILFSFVTLFFLVTGLFWTGWWGTKIDVVADRFGAGKPAQVRNGVSSTTLEEIVESGKPAWSRSKVPVPLSGVATGGGGHAGHGGATGLEWDPTKGAPLDAVVAQAQNLGFPPGFAIYMPADATGSYAIANWPDIEGNPNQRASASQDAYFDQYTGEVLGNYKETQYGAFAKLSDLGISLHEGRQFGVWNQLGTLVATLAILLSSATSIVMWRKRRPVGLGAPPKVENRRATWTVGAFAAVLGIIFPPLGLTLVAVLLLDLLVVNRLPALARAFGTAAPVGKPVAVSPGEPPAAAVDSADAAAPLKVRTISPGGVAAQANGQGAGPASSNGEGMDGPSTCAGEDTGDRPVFPL
jgi:uncharacterized iron-regulated membrane protein